MSKSSAYIMVQRARFALIAGRKIVKKRKIFCISSKRTVFPHTQTPRRNPASLPDCGAGSVRGEKPSVLSKYKKRAFLHDLLPHD
jgi:hypothetical protein